jgi:hypothetical protein
MKFRALQDNLRRTLWARIEAGELTGLRLAEQTGFRQAHISNFLNKKRGLSVEGMDNVLQVQHLSVLDLLDPGEINQRASIVPPSSDEFEDVKLVDASVAASLPVIPSMHVKDMHKFRKQFLRKLRSDLQERRGHWERFVLLRANHDQGVSMYPRLAPGATVLVDRHYNSTRPYRKNESNLYAVRKGSGCSLTYLEISGRQLVLRPHSSDYPVHVIALAEGEKAQDHIIGRICWTGMEL